MTAETVIIRKIYNKKLDFYDVTTVTRNDIHIFPYLIKNLT